MARRLGSLLLVLAFVAAGASAVFAQYQRPVDAAPSEKAIGGGYVTPLVQRPLPRAHWLELTDVGVLVLALGLGSWLVLWRRSRTGLVALTVGSLAYFGFYREGCVCPIGAIQNVTVALTDPSYAIPLVVIAFFFLPLVAAVLLGRVYCGAACPFGALQDLVLLRPVVVPRPLDKLLGLFRYVYLALAIVFAALPAGRRDFLICRYDPFVDFFRRSGSLEMLLLGAGLLIVGMFIGRPYCRYLCPYGGLLSLLSRFARRGVTITPDKELDCGLCSRSCPYGAIENMRAVRSACLACNRCYRACPRERVRQRPLPLKTAAPQEAG